MRQFSYFTEANWMSTYVNSEQLWVNDCLNWEKISSIALSDTSFLSFLYNSSFISHHLLTDSITKFSTLDFLLIMSNNRHMSFQTLFLSFLLDLHTDFFNLYLPYIPLFSSSYQDSTSMVLLLSPDLILAFKEFYSTYFFESSINFLPAAVFDSFVNNLTYHVCDGAITFVTFFFYIWTLVYFVLMGSSLRWSTNYMNHMIRFQYFFYAVAKETRFQYEAVLQIFVFLIFYWVAALMTFDDDQEEMLELVNSLYVYFFTTLLCYIVYKHSIHIFAFFELTINEKRSNNFVNQFRADLQNSVLIIVRFYMTIVRVNIYDTVEDILDTYYVFVGDFDDDEYVNELFFSLHGTLFFTMDNHDDRSFLLEDESDFSYDLYYLYYILWGKFAFFFFFTLEMAGKIILGLYISFLIIFEMQGVSASYQEDNYIVSKRQE
jgi:hypothetical protein